MATLSCDCRSCGIVSRTRMTRRVEASFSIGQAGKFAERTKAVFANILIFYAALMWASGNLLPTGGVESVWFLSATALRFFSLLSAPYFVPLRDAIANAIAAACILVTADLTVAGALKKPLEIVRWLAVIYCVWVTGLALTALFLHDRDRSSSVGRLCYRLTAVL